MRNPLREVVERELSRLGISNAKLVQESHSPQSFGNAEANYSLGNLQLHFVRDRGHDTVSIGSSGSPRRFILEDIALWMGWISLDELLKHDRPPNFDEPPPGPIISLSKALELVARDLQTLDSAFSAGETASTDAQLKDMEGKRVSAASLS